MIRIQNVHKYFNKGKQNEIHVINDVSLELPERGMVAVFGRSGCGKTTLLNVVGGLDGYQKGTITLEGKDISKHTDELRNRYVGYIFQNYNLQMGESCFENVADALRLCGVTDKEQIQSRVMAALKNVGMEKYAARTPDTLSGGQQQRIAIARAIVKNPRVILADEPTGNLDETNTVMVMDMLKEISKTQLVLIVTHEANLVDYYCDTVIELSDGKVVTVRDNQAANGYVVRDKNDVFLGELNKNELQNSNVQVEYYGEPPKEPVSLTVVNSGGKLFVRINTPSVRVVDENCEVKLRQGVFHERAKPNAVSEHLDMTPLPPVEGKRYGRLFDFLSSVRSGYIANFPKKKKGKSILRACMMAFAAVFVLMVATFGTFFETLINVDESYHHNAFYVYTPDETVKQTLFDAVGKEETGIDFARINDSSVRYPGISIRSFGFETSQNYINMHCMAVLFDTTVMGEQPLVAGRNTELANNELVVTTRVADKIIEAVNLPHLRDYGDVLLLGEQEYLSYGYDRRLVGIVECDEPNVYLSEAGLTEYVNTYLVDDPVQYTVLHSIDPERTAAYLKENFSTLQSPSIYSYLSAIITPEDLYNEEMESVYDSIVVSAVALTVMLALLCVCMYFIMRSSLLNRVKEVGIYRAIGASKKNILFKFLVEAGVLTALTVFVGFVLMSGFIHLSIALTSNALSLFFYPVWLALATLAVLLVVCLACGVIPVFTLIRKSPSQILAKYDI